MEYGKVRFFDLYILKPMTAVYLALGAWSVLSGFKTGGGISFLAAVVTFLVTRNLSGARVEKAARTAPTHDSTGMDFEGYIIAKNAILASVPLGAVAFAFSWHMGYRFWAVVIGVGAFLSFPALVLTLIAYIQKRRGS